MVQHKEDEEKVQVNGEVKNVENGETKTNENASDEADEDSDDDDYLDYLLMVPTLDNYSNDRNKCLVSKTLLDLCSAIESRKEYPKIRQELMMLNNCVPKAEEKVDEIKEEKEDEHPKIVEEISEPQICITNGDDVDVDVRVKEDTPTTSTSTEDDTTSTSTSQESEKIVPEGRRQSVRLKKAEFGKKFHNFSL